MYLADIEDEMHLLIKCQKYHTLRIEFPDETKTDQQKFTYLMKNSNKNVIKLVGLHLSTARS